MTAYPSRPGVQPNDTELFGRDGVKRTAAKTRSVAAGARQGYKISAHLNVIHTKNAI